MNFDISLRDYIESSVTKKFSDRLSIRLSKELAVKYDNSEYDAYLNHVNEMIKIIDSLDIKYPCDAKPRFYIYIVPREKVSILNVPPPFNANGSGGKPVPSFDLDGYSKAYGITENIALNTVFKTDREANTIHELTHLVESMFYDKDRFIGEGIAEAVPLYVLDYEYKFNNHRNALLNMDRAKIKNFKVLNEESHKGGFGDTGIEGFNSCTFKYSYISSYLLCASILDAIKDKFKISKKEAFQKFLELVRSCNFYQELLIKEIAAFIDISPEILINSTELQNKYLDKIKR